MAVQLLTKINEARNWALAFFMLWLIETSSYGMCPQAVDASRLAYGHCSFISSKRAIIALRTKYHAPFIYVRTYTLLQLPALVNCHIKLHAAKCSCWWFWHYNINLVALSSQLCTCTWPENIVHLNKITTLVASFQSITTFNHQRVYRNCTTVVTCMLLIYMSSLQTAIA